MELEEALEILQAEEADLVDRADAIEKVGIASRRDLAPQVAQFLKHDSALLRTSAIKSLVGFMVLGEYIPVAIEMMMTEEKMGDRSAAAFALTLCGEDDVSYQDQIVRAFCAAIRANENDYVCAVAYQGFLKLAIPGSDHNFETLDFKRSSIDWSLLEPYLAN